ncbi:hypothetical protein [Comamonas fluminis]|uniref:hypothetical protein n=1 Tax=Comamonas fluminis TaxID=2796366 RepID=UPI001C47F4FA|nr:hypothetical protein [Comamonas fluminis]
MLLDHELARLCELLALTAESMGHAVSPTAAAMMAADLSMYPLQALERALQRVRAQNTGKLTLKAVLDQLEALAGRLAPSEAWALALKSADESATVVWSNEIQLAHEQSRGLLAAGDKVGARMAFIAAYERITTTAREQRQLPTPLVSIGWDTAQRQEALTQAVSAGLLPMEMAAEHLDRLSLPAPVFNPVALLEGKASTTSEASPELKAKLVQLRDFFAKRVNRFTRAQVQARAERMALGRTKRATAQAVQDYQQGGAR